VRWFGRGGVAGGKSADIHPAAERDSGNGKIKNLAKSVFGSPALHAAGGGAPKPSVSGDEADTKYVRLQPE
jgi:hypothetical protein